MNTSSHGLGLHISQRIAESHNGRINVKSIYSEGSEFEFRFLAKKSKDKIK